MPSRRRLQSALPLAALALLALTGCGGGDERTSAATETTTVTKTVTVPATTPTGTTGTTGTTPAPPPNPDAPLSLQTAEQTLDRRGYATLTERDFHPDQQLKVLIGVRRAGGATDAGAQLAFFFVGDRFIGTDSTATSGRIAVTAQQDDAITLTYSLYRTADDIDGPTGGSADVTFRWTGSKLEPQSTIPTADPLVSPSRR